MAINAGTVYSELVLDTSKYEQALENADKQMNNLAKNFEKAGKQMEKAGKTLSKYVTAPIVGLGTLSSKAAIDFESAFAGVRKTVDASEEDFERLGKGIRDMSKEIPASATAIAEVAEAAGQLGIKTENILEFSRVMIDLGEATNLSADEAATSLARLANITGMSQQDFDKLGSSIVALGNNLATTEAEIVAMGLRLAGAGAQIGLSEAQIMSFAAALSSVGIEAEAGGSAFSKVMVDMQLAVETNSERLKEFAEVAGMSGEEFKRAFQEDAAGAIIAFIRGLGTAEKRGLSAIKVLDDMGISEIRLRDALLRASGASDVFADSLEIGTKAWEENTALTKEAEQRYKTTASQIEIAKNYLKDAGITIGEIVVPHIISLAEKVKDVAQWFKSLNPETQETIVKMAGLAATIGPLLVVGGKLSQGLGSIITLFAKLKGASAAATTASTAMGSSIGAAGLAAKASALLFNPWTAAIVGGGLAAVELVKYFREDTIPAVELFDETISESTKNAISSFMELEQQATASLNYLGMSGTRVSEDMYNNITTNVSQMTDEVIAKLEEQKVEGLKHLKEMLDKSTSMSEEEKEEAIRIATEKYDTEIQKAQEGKARIEEILLEAKEKNRSITEEERLEIEGILTSLKDNSINLMTESQLEQETILQNLKENATRLTAEMMANVVANSIEQKQKTIAEAEEQYQKVVATAEMLKKDGTAESKELAENMIAEAKRQKEETIKEAEEMHQKVLDELKRQGGDLIKQIDLDNGKIKSKWQELKEWFANNPIIRTIRTIFEDDPVARDLERRDRVNPVGRNAMGTNYWRGGLTWVGEQGPELIELPRGSKVYSNQKSMEMVKSAGKGITQNITIISPEPLSPSEIARKNLQVSRQLAMEWGL